MSTKVRNVYGSKQIVALLELLQEAVPDVSDNIVEDILTKCIENEETKLPKVVLTNWQKSKNGNSKAVKGAKKSEKDQTAPKAPRTAYLRFSMSGVREIIKNEKPGINPRDVMVEIGARWKALSEEERKPFVDAEKEERKQYEAENPKPKRATKAKKSEELDFVLEETSSES